MRDIRFVAEHRGGFLNILQHRQLVRWSCVCAENVLQLSHQKSDESLKNVLLVAEEWASGNVTTGDARKASLEAIAVAKITTDRVSIAVARSVGHAVATAHMADHSLGAAAYALMAAKAAGKSTDKEREWQNEQLPGEIRELVLSVRSAKENAFRYLRP